MAQEAHKSQRTGTKPIDKPPEVSSEAGRDVPRDDRTGFPVVGIGASAGGLEALEQFLAHVPEASGMAFVIVQHLDPMHKGVMPELLQRATTLKVVQAKERLQVEPNCVYVIPPNKDMSILHGVLHLTDPVTSKGTAPSD